MSTFAILAKYTPAAAVELKIRTVCLKLEVLAGVALRAGRAWRAAHEPLTLGFASGGRILGIQSAGRT
jgi:hypothetical protein